MRRGFLARATTVKTATASTTTVRAVKPVDTSSDPVASELGHAGHDPADDDHAPGGHGGHDHADHAELFRRKFWVSLALTVPTVVYSAMVQDWLGYTAPEFRGSTWVAPLFGTLVFAWGGPVFLRAGWGELRARQPGMMLLISMGLLVAFGASVATELDWIDVELWFELSTLVTIMLLGHWLEMRAIMQARGALAALAELLPDRAERVVGDLIETVALDDLRVGDLVLVRPGARVPADGVIVEGRAEIDEAMLTGESRPVAKDTGDRVVAGTVATDSAIRVRVDAVGPDTALAGIQRLVEEAQQSDSRAQALADRFAGWLFYVAAGSGLATFVVWLALGQVDQAVERTVTVLVIACPHALGLAIPLTVAVSTAIAARAGILVKDRLAVERMRTVDAVLFDKTGTLTTGTPIVLGVAGDTRDRRRRPRAGRRDRDAERAPARPSRGRRRDRARVARPDRDRLRGDRGTRRRRERRGRVDRGRQPGAGPRARL